MIAHSRRAMQMPELRNWSVAGGTWLAKNARGGVRVHHDDQKRKDRDQQERPNRESNMEPAEGSRENTRTAGNQGGRGTSTMDPEAPRGGQDSEGGSELPPESFGEQGGGISNRPIEEEESRQENLPPRGERREDWKDD